MTQRRRGMEEKGGGVWRIGEEGVEERGGGGWRLGEKADGEERRRRDGGDGRR